MQTHFSLAQLANADTAECEKILRSCVHCGICLSVCPTYTLLGDERDSPRGRIYLMKDSFENEKSVSASLGLHLDRCLNCLACIEVCPSGVDYKHLIDHGRHYIESENPRSITQRALRAFLARMVSDWRLFAFAMPVGQALRPLNRMMLRLWAGLEGKKTSLLQQQFKAMLALIPKDKPRTLLAAQIRAQAATTQVFSALGQEKARVVMLLGCAQRALEPEINEASLRLLRRLGCTVLVPEIPCCGSLRHHMGQSAIAQNQARSTIDAVLGCGEVDGFVINASGCGASIKDYAHILRHDRSYQDKAETLANISFDICEFISKLDFATAVQPEIKAMAAQQHIAYHASCSLQNSQKIKASPKELLKAAGFSVHEPKNAHLCCGSAGVYNILQPQIAQQLGAKKAQSLLAKQPDWICAGNLGCLTQIRQQPEWPQNTPVVHTVQLLDWVSGGPKPI